MGHRKPAPSGFPQAFGRNSYSDAEVWAVATVRDSLGNDLETFEWLKAKDFDAGCPNERLATLCYTYLTMLTYTENRSKPIIGQWEVMYDLYRLWPDWYEKHQRNLFVIWPPRKGYLATHGLLLKVKAIAEEYEWKIPLVVAHPEHIQRCFFLARKIFRTTPAIHTGMPSEKYFDKGSVQRWTRNKWYWLFYELCLARPHHRLKGWL